MAPPMWEERDPRPSIGAKSGRSGYSLGLLHSSLKSDGGTSVLLGHTEVDRKIDRTHSSNPRSSTRGDRGNECAPTGSLTPLDPPLAGGSAREGKMIKSVAVLTTRTEATAASLYVTRGERGSFTSE